MYLGHLPWFACTTARPISTHHFFSVLLYQADISGVISDIRYVRPVCFRPGNMISTWDLDLMSNIRHLQVQMPARCAIPGRNDFAANSRFILASLIVVPAVCARARGPPRPVVGVPLYGLHDNISFPYKGPSKNIRRTRTTTNEPRTKHERMKQQ